MACGIKMIKLVFAGPQRKLFQFDIDGKTVVYFDELWKDGIKILPKDNKLITKMMRSGNKNVQVMAALILDANKGKNLKEYVTCKTEEDIAEMIKKDCKEKGLLEVN